MGTYGWRTDHSVREWLLEEGYRFDFYQAVKLLELMRPKAPSVGTGFLPSREAVRFKSRVGLDFPASAISEIEEKGQDQPFEMQVNFMGLAGLLGPLPLPYTESVLQRTFRKDYGLREFLDLFNHRLISLLYRIRKLHRLGLTHLPPDESHFADYLLSLIGLGLPTLQGRFGRSERPLLYYSGLLAQQPRSAKGLELILADYFKVPVRIQQFVGSWDQLEESQRTHLGLLQGTNNALGQSAVLGLRVWMQQEKFRIVLGPLGMPDFLNFLPNGAFFSSLCRFVRFYVGDTLEYDIELKLQRGEAPQSRLGFVGGARLGWSSWMSSQAAPDQDYSVRLHLRPLPPEIEKLSFPFFADLTNDQITDIVHQMKNQEHPRGTIVARQGDPGEAVYIVQQGTLRVVRTDAEGQELPIASIKEGGFFGEITQLSGKLQNSTYITEEPCVLLELSQHQLLELLEKFPALERALLPSTSKLLAPLKRFSHLKRSVAGYFLWHKPDVFLRLKKNKELKTFFNEVGQHKILAEMEKGGNPLFVHMHREDFPELLEKVQSFRFRRKSVITHQGMPSDQLYIIVFGKVRLIQRQKGQPSRVIGFRTRGQVFGEEALLRREPMHYSAVAEEDSEIWMIKVEDLMRLVQKYPGIERAVKVLAHQRAWIEEVGT